MKRIPSKFSSIAALAMAALCGCTQAQYYTTPTYVPAPTYGQYPPQYPPQYVQYPQGTPPLAPWVSGTQVVLNTDQLDQLLSPIALYPDPLLSLILPAATYPQDVAVAQQWLQAAPNPTEADISAQPWDPSVKGLTHYPTVLKMMSDQMDWTNALGAAFLNQQADVMASVQRLRVAAQMAQNLRTSEQQQVLVDGDAIRIEPVNPQVIYVPQYDPILIYRSPCPTFFSIGFSLGLWCDNDFDWRRRCVVVGGGWFHEWRHPDDWDRRRRDWDHHADDWRPDPRPWERVALRPAPRLTTQVIARTGLDNPRPSPARPDVRTGSRSEGRDGRADARTEGRTEGRTDGRTAPGATPSANPPRRIGDPPAKLPSKNVIVPPAGRSEVEQERQRNQRGTVNPATPTTAVPTAPIGPTAPVQPKAPVINRPQPAPVQPAPAQPKVVPAQPDRPALRTPPPPAAPRTVVPAAPRTVTPAPAPKAVPPAPPARAVTPAQPPKAVPPAQTAKPIPRIAAPKLRVEPAQAPRVSAPAAPAARQNAPHEPASGKETRQESDRGRDLRKR